MRMLRLLLPLLFCLAVSGADVLNELLPGEPTRADLDRAHGMLEQWEQEQPEKARLVMHSC